MRLEDKNEQITGNVCPECTYPTVLEFGLEVCYKCGWFNNSDDGITDEKNGVNI